MKFYPRKTNLYHKKILIINVKFKNYWRCANNGNLSLNQKKKNKIIKLKK